MITVGTPGLGVRHPEEKSSEWEIVRMEYRWMKRPLRAWTVRFSFGRAKEK
jgi:hypothetical protein